MSTRKYWLAALAGAVLLHSAATFAHDDDDDDDDGHYRGHHSRYHERHGPHFVYGPAVVVQPEPVYAAPPPAVVYAPPPPAMVYEPRVYDESALAPILFGAAIGAYLGHAAAAR